MNCSTCGNELPARRRAYCSDDCAKDGARNLLLGQRYGLTVKELEALWEYQLGKCAICRRVLSKANSAIDHDHITGVTRGILCIPCNRRLLPASRESTDILIGAIEYLTFSPAVRLLGKRIGSDPVLKGKPRRKRKRKRVASKQRP